MKSIENTTGSKEFTCVFAVAKVNGTANDWESYQPFIDSINGNPIHILTFKDMVIDIQKNLTTTLAATEVGRLPQMFKAAGLHIEKES